MSKRGKTSSAPHHPVRVLEVHWVPERHEFELQARPVTVDGEDTGPWVTHEAGETGLAQLLSLGHDIVTGG
jgi:hypothetical protein